MTVAVALVCQDGALLASDSMGASGALASTVTKVHSCGKFPLLWTWAGSSYLGQQVGRALSSAARQVDPLEWAKQDPFESAEQIVKNVQIAVKAAAEPLLAPRGENEPHDAEFLIAGFTQQPFVAHIKDDLAWELQTGDQLLAIGSGHAFATVTRSLMKHYLEGGLTLEQAKVISYRTVETVCDVSSYGVSVPVQIATVDAVGARVLDSDEVAAVGISVDRWKQLERDTLRSGFEERTTTDDLPTLNV